jgi:tRNA threonylcarbamoyladenosine biosynthesis protein TsaB
MSRILLLETSSRQGQMALASGGSIITEMRLESSTRRASDLAVTLERLLQEANWQAKELTQIIVGLGPGSFTGLRVGLASAKALAYAVGCEFIGVETFAAIATRSPNNGVIAIVADALQGHVFTRTYRQEGEHLEPLTPHAVVPFATWLSELPSDCTITGPGASLINDSVRRILDEEFREPTPLSLLRAAQYPWAVTNDIWLAEPLYLRGSSAEEKRQRERR